MTQLQLRACSYQSNICALKISTTYQLQAFLEAKVGRLVPIHISQDWFLTPIHNYISMIFLFCPFFSVHIATKQPSIFCNSHFDIYHHDDIYEKADANLFEDHPLQKKD